MKVLVTGSSGLVGKQLVADLKSHGWDVVRLVRSGKAGDGADIFWDPKKKSIARESLEGLKAVVHLAGENIADGSWTAEKKEKIRSSRVDGTRFLSETLAGLQQKPEVLISASAIGFYGVRDDEVLTEASPPGEGFLSDVCREWEEATAPAKAAGIRVVNARIGVILSEKGGALKKMLFPFKCGLGGILGNGKQWMSWIALDDVTGAIEHCLRMTNISGPINFVAPRPVTNREFTKALGCALRRPTLFPVPASMVRVVFGEMGDALLLGSCGVMPTKLNEFSYTFKHQDLFWALKSMV